MSLVRPKAAGREFGMLDISDQFKEATRPWGPTLFIKPGDELEAYRKASEGTVVAHLVTGMPRKNEESIYTLVSMSMDSKVQQRQDVVKEGQPTIDTPVGITVHLTNIVCNFGECWCCDYLGLRQHCEIS